MQSYCDFTIECVVLSEKGKQKGWPSVSIVTYVIINIGAGDTRSFFFLLLLASIVGKSVYCVICYGLGNHALKPNMKRNMK